MGQVPADLHRSKDRITPGYLPYLVITLITFSTWAAPVKKSEAVMIGGIRQWISTQGSDDRNPLLLFLHGGPGNSAMRYADQFTGELQKHFVVIQWDQPGSGKTAKMNPSDKPATLERMVADARELILYLEQVHQQKKIYLMGHSWGGFLALEVASRYPELLQVCLAISPMVNQTESERLSLEWMKGEASSRYPSALAELATIAIPFRSDEDLFLHRKWLAVLQGNRPVSRSFVSQWAAKNWSLFLEASHVNLFENVPEFACPVYFFLGGKDHQTESLLTERYFKLVKAEKKDVFWFPDSGHNLHLKEPLKFQEIIITLSGHP